MVRFINCYNNYGNETKIINKEYRIHFSLKKVTKYYLSAFWIKFELLFMVKIVFCLMDKTKKAYYCLVYKTKNAYFCLVNRTKVWIRKY